MLTTERYEMKKLSIAMALIFSLAVTSAFACPKGTHLVGGTGSHHKGGKCVAADGKADAKPAASKPEAKSEAKADAKPAKKDKKKADVAK